MTDVTPIPAAVDDTTFAEDVKVVKRYIHTAFGERKDGYTPARKVLHEWATKRNSQDEYVNMEKFWKMDAEADKVLKDTATGDFIAEKSRKSIKQLHELLTELVEKSKGIQP